jgi:hypothetical protein
VIRATPALIAITLLTCTLTRADLKNTAHGIYSLTRINAAHLSDDPSWTDPNITGVIVRTWWKHVQPIQGTFQWGYLDQGLKLARKYHKKLGFTVVAGQWSPDWIYTAGSQKFVIQNVGSMPCPWDKVFLNYWQQFILEFGARYDSYGDVSYVTAEGPGRTEECYFCKSQADVDELAADFGGSLSTGIQAWVNAAETIAGYYASAFPTTPFVYADGTPIPGDDTDYATLVSYCVTAFGSQFGIKSDGLSPIYRAEFAKKEIPLLSPTHPVGFQDFRGFKDPTDLQQALTNGINLTGHYIEVYTKDVTATADQTIIQQGQAALTGH